MVGAGLTTLGASLVLLFLFAIFLVVRAFALQFQHVFLPLAVAGILATLLQPMVDLLTRRLRIRRTGSIVLLFFLIFSGFSAILLYLVPLLFKQALDLIDFVPVFGKQVLRLADENMPWLFSWFDQQAEGAATPRQSLQEFLSQYRETIRGTLVGLIETLQATGQVLFGVAGLAASYAVVPIYLFYLLKRERSGWDVVEEQLSFLNDGLKSDILFLLKKFVELLVSFFRGQILVGLMMAVLFMVGFGLIGLRFAVLLGLLIGLANIVPYLGTILGVLFVGPIALLQEGGGWLLVGLAAVVFLAVQAISDYLLTPWVMGDKTGMGPMLIIFSIFFWGTALGGILGMVLAIPLTAFFLVFWYLVRDKYLPKWKEAG